MIDMGTWIPSEALKKKELGSACALALNIGVKDRNVNKFFSLKSDF